MRRVTALLLAACSLAAPLAAQTWVRTYGREVRSAVGSVVLPTSDGGYLVSGLVWDGSFPTIWLLKLDEVGDVEWEQVRDTLRSNSAVALFETPRGYLIAGNAEGSSPEPEAIRVDFFVMEIDHDGVPLWQRAYSGASYDRCRTAIATSDGGYLLAGYTESFGAGEEDAWLVKIDETGELEWQASYGGPDSDEAEGLLELPGGGYLVTGHTRSWGEGADDAWLLEIDPLGAIRSQRTFGSADASQHGVHLARAADGDILLFGRNNLFAPDNWELWMVRLDPTGDTIRWQKSWQAHRHLDVPSLLPTGGDFVLAGYETPSTPGSRWGYTMKLTEDGEQLWLRRHSVDADGSRTQELAHIAASHDGGLIAVGESRRVSGNELFLLSLAADGTLEAGCVQSEDETFVEMPTTSVRNDSTAVAFTTDAVVREPDVPFYCNIALIEQHCGAGVPGPPPERSLVPEIEDLRVAVSGPDETHLTWESGRTHFSDVTYIVATGALEELHRVSGFRDACLEDAGRTPSLYHVVLGGDDPSRWYLVLGENGCGTGRSGSSVGAPDARATVDWGGLPFCF
ncbi:MAG: hypothetical protein AAF533_15010 [Acidobacteriota bacterium]